MRAKRAPIVPLSEVRQMELLIHSMEYALSDANILSISSGDVSELERMGDVGVCDANKSLVTTIIMRLYIYTVNTMQMF